MRILHTADWHLGGRLGPHDRTDELFGQVERVLALATQHRVDVLLVAGDVFDHRALPELTKRLAELLRPHLRRGLHVILVPGNHDNREHFRMMRTLLTLEGDASRLHVVQTREVFIIDGVQWAVLPYPTRELLESGRSGASGTSDRNKVLSAAYADLVRAVVGALNPQLPAVFVGHITVAGVHTPSDRELTYDEDIRLGTADLPLASNLAYVALGHIHQQQHIAHPIPCYYSGSIDRLNLGERDDETAVLLVDVPPMGPASVTTLPLPATPFYDIHVAAEELDTLPVRYPDLARAFTRIAIDGLAGTDSVALQRRVRELSPRCLDIRFTGTTLSSASDTAWARPTDYRTTVIDYLRDRWGSDPALPELERRAIALLQEVGDVTAAN